jgi:hypothetical protein
MAKFVLHIEYTLRTHTKTLQKNMEMPKFGLHIEYTVRTQGGGVGFFSVKGWGYQFFNLGERKHWELGQFKA